MPDPLQPPPGLGWPGAVPVNFQLVLQVAIAPLRAAYERLPNRPLSALYATTTADRSAQRIGQCHNTYEAREVVVRETGCDSIGNLLRAIASHETEVKVADLLARHDGEDPCEEVSDTDAEIARLTEAAEISILQAHGFQVCVIACGSPACRVYGQRYCSLDTDPPFFWLPANVQVWGLAHPGVIGYVDLASKGPLLLLFILAVFAIFEVDPVDLLHQVYDLMSQTLSNDDIGWPSPTLDDALVVLRSTLPQVASEPLSDILGIMGLHARPAMRPGPRAIRTVLLIFRLRSAKTGIKAKAQDGLVVLLRRYARPRLARVFGIPADDLDLPVALITGSGSDLFTDYARCESWVKPEYSFIRTFRELQRGDYESVAVIGASSIPNTANIIQLASNLGPGGMVIQLHLNTKPLVCRAPSLAYLARRDYNILSSIRLSPDAGLLGRHDAIRPLAALASDAYTLPNRPEEEVMRRAHHHRYDRRIASYTRLELHEADLVARWPFPDLGPACKVEEIKVVPSSAEAAVLQGDVAFGEDRLPVCPEELANMKEVFEGCGPLFGPVEQRCGNPDCDESNNLRHYDDEGRPRCTDCWPWFEALGRDKNTEDNEGCWDCGRKNPSMLAIDDDDDDPRCPRCLRQQRLPGDILSILDMQVACPMCDENKNLYCLATLGFSPPGMPRFVCLACRDKLKKRLTDGRRDDSPQSLGEARALGLTTDTLIKHRLIKYRSGTLPWPAGYDSYPTASLVDLQNRLDLAAAIAKVSPLDALFGSRPHGAPPAPIIPASNRAGASSRIGESSGAQSSSGRPFAGGARLQPAAEAQEEYAASYGAHFPCEDGKESTDEQAVAAGRRFDDNREDYDDEVETTTGRMDGRASGKGKGKATLMDHERWDMEDTLERGNELWIQGRAAAPPARDSRNPSPVSGSSIGRHRVDHPFDSSGRKGQVNSSSRPSRDSGVSSPAAARRKPTANPPTPSLPRASSWDSRGAEKRTLSMLESDEQLARCLQAEEDEEARKRPRRASQRKRSAFRGANQCRSASTASLALDEEAADSADEEALKAHSYRPRRASAAYYPAATPVAPSNSGSLCLPTPPPLDNTLNTYPAPSSVQLAAAAAPPHMLCGGISDSVFPNVAGVAGRLWLELRGERGVSEGVEAQGGSASQEHAAPAWDGQTCSGVSGMVESAAARDAHKAAAIGDYDFDEPAGCPISLSSWFAAGDYSEDDSYGRRNGSFVTSLFHLLLLQAPIWFSCSAEIHDQFDWYDDDSKKSGQQPGETFQPRVYEYGQGECNGLEMLPELAVLEAEEEGVEQERKREASWEQTQEKEEENPEANSGRGQADRFVSSSSECDDDGEDAQDEIILLATPPRVVKDLAASRRYRFKSSSADDPSPPTAPFRRRHQYRRAR
ncbi:hypothetical protein JCM11641_006664 [Rhodosporidiobolus odoratus]